MFVAHDLSQRLSLDSQILTHETLSKAADGNVDLQRMLELFAAVTWSIIAEPGDEFVGYLRRTIGLPLALALLIERATPAAWLSQLERNDPLELGSSRFGDVSAILPDALERYRPRISLAVVQAKLDQAQKLRLTLLDHSHRQWPTQLEVLEFGSPPLLWVRGSADTLRQSLQSIALVGSRTPTQYGAEVTESLVQGAANHGFAIVSGGAFGIDAMAHRCALAVETPTLAVMAGGVDLLYPRSNQQLLERVAHEGAVVSEVSLGTAPAKWRFLQRNRLIAALSQVTVVVEAGYRSGAINTANHAASLGLPVGAVPGSILSSRSQGCHKLISDGRAELIGSAADVIALARSGALFEHEPSSSLSALENRVLDAIGFGSKTAESICAEAGLTLQEARIGIASLSLLGVIEREGQCFRRL